MYKLYIPLFLSVKWDGNICRAFRGVSRFVFIRGRFNSSTGLVDWFWSKFVWMLISWRHIIWPEMSLLYYGEVLWFFYFKTFWPNYNLDLRSYRQLLSLFFINIFISLSISIQGQYKNQLFFALLLLDKHSILYPGSLNYIYLGNSKLAISWPVLEIVNDQFQLNKDLVSSRL